MVEQAQDGTWKVLSVDNRDPSVGGIPGIDWPLQAGDDVVVIGLGDTDCLRIREQPTQQGKQLNCVPDGTKAIVQEGPKDAETFTLVAHRRRRLQRLGGGHVAAAAGRRRGGVRDGSDPRAGDGDAVAVADRAPRLRYTRGEASTSGGNSIGRVLAFQAGSCGFESRPPLQLFDLHVALTDLHEAVMACDAL